MTPSVPPRVCRAIAAFSLLLAAGRAVGLPTASKTSGYILAIVESSENQAAGAAADFHEKLQAIQDAAGESFLGHEDEQALQASVQSLKSKAELLDGKARMAGLAPAKEAKRSGYDSDARKRDLRRGQIRVKRALQKAKEDSAKLPPPQNDFLGDLRDYLSEAKSHRNLLSQVMNHLEPVAKGGNPQAADVLARLKLRGRRMDSDIQDLDREIRILEIDLTLQHLQEAQ